MNDMNMMQSFNLLTPIIEPTPPTDQPKTTAERERGQDAGGGHADAADGYAQISLNVGALEAWLIRGCRLQLLVVDSSCVAMGLPGTMA